MWPVTVFWNPLFITLAFGNDTILHMSHDIPRYNMWNSFCSYLGFLIQKLTSPSDSNSNDRTEQQQDREDGFACCSAPITATATTVTCADCDCDSFRIRVFDAVVDCVDETVGSGVTGIGGVRCPAQTPIGRAGCNSIV